MRVHRFIGRCRPATSGARLATLARARYGRRFLLIPLAATVAVGAAWVAFPFLFERFGHLWPFDFYVGSSMGLVAAVWLFGLVIVPAGVFVALRRAMAVRCARLQRDGARCFSCGFPLWGLREVGGGVRCPECGREHRDWAPSARD